MNGHWLSQTRKLNKHYQSGARVTPAPLWGALTLFNFGVSLDSYCGLMLDNDGIYVNTRGDKAITVPQNINLSSSGFVNILPLRIYDLTGLTVTGVNFGTLGTVTDDSGKIKSKVENVNFEFETPSQNIIYLTRQCLIVYLDMVDVDKTSGGYTRQKTYFNVKFPERFRVPKTTPIDVNVNYNCLVGEYNGTSCGVTVESTKRFFFDNNNVVQFYPPDIGSFVSMDASFTIPSGDVLSLYAPTIGLCGVSGQSIGVGNGIIDRRSSQANVALFDRGYVLTNLSSTYSYLRRVYTIDFDTSILRSTLDFGTIQGTNTLFNKTTVTGWT